MDIDPIMQAAERLRRFYDSDEDIDVTWPGRPEHVEQLDWMYQNKEADVRAVLGVFPKGKRPVAIDAESLDVGTTVFFIEDENLDLYWGKVITTPRPWRQKGVEFESSICYGGNDGAYPSQVDAQIERHYRLLGRVIAAANGETKREEVDE